MTQTVVRGAHGWIIWCCPDTLYCQRLARSMSQRSVGPATTAASQSRCREAARAPASSNL